MADKFLNNLNARQQEAVTFSGGPLLVLAGAGSGKTRVLTYRVAWFIDQGRVRSENVLLLTFTNKAATEMKERVLNLIHEVPAFAGTFHSFCVRVLRKDGLAIDIPANFLIYDEDDSKEIIKEILTELNLSTDKYNPNAISSQISEAKNQMLTPSLYAELVRGEWQEKVFKIWTEYEKLLKKVGALDFDDLLLKAVKLFDESPETLTRWQDVLTHIFVDEWQDTNKVQYKLTKQLVEQNENLTAVGDAAQSIYSWRGADFRNINNLIRDYPKLKVINLEQNYRSTQTILDAANSVIKRNTLHPILKLWTDKVGSEKIKVYRARSELDEAQFVLGEVDKLITQGLEFHDFAILYRTNAQSRVLEEAFLHAGIPYTLVGGVRFYSRKEVKDVISFLRLLVNPKDRVSKKRIEKLGIRQVERFQNFEKDLPENWSEKLTTLSLMDAMFQKTDYLSKYHKETEENLARLENIKELRSVATAFPNLTEFLENVALVEAEQSEKGIVRHQEESKGKVTLMTLHAAKGLEFPTVFIVGMEEGLFPHARSLFDMNQLEEERRLAYVGITRAKDILYLTYAGRRLYFGQRASNPPSRFIIDIPENLLEGVENSYLEIEESDNTDTIDLDALDDSINF
ncbi:hypothetical protein A2962_00685 [Candidatus Woesebacteria bacterium RIFCSPLOWO2_01_FULL_39_61]|uniref:DNA 3'-5' helicase n=1 Tax=Candidatus Woesebacteria bacterium RIFCSPHIGHO2_02_FULL_39_13 TaxID=1802505 RepID=A0A1F7Z467_9BACT|nr:MAG: hypothetical protein A2692_04815 [Candidatus Woesebacteria bacterium RIFCSPHIGHO2_01_FULL_39_95]OGM33575.1 MAG: hypothetical protein A3D01_01310 [Candidatus Woesebacteria bacterium RIFCSPHIGHO2_02_FULL_39_13]OGM36695.1 MAG: hypothetical protein A3E13_00180 [Candidatus Woesebacteria bacterium RIFCSPHIGHO2_12_FULL_40_20]OGM68568.1 MAG: hypothetical protein A2962_00685 [Candidatus Woesebacteria bacterium RIFCSPLOWO2_01_FULL_39_61]OGM71669.1 MAG: hypothetical protein A3H19_01470 [Candidatus